MPHLVERLREEHEILLQMIECGVSDERSVSTFYRELLQARDLILAHLQREDETVYPTLREAARDDQRLQRIVSLYGDETVSFSEVVTSFYQRHGDGVPKPGFRKELEAVAVLLRLRIVREEGLILPEYQALT